MSGNDQSGQGRRPDQQTSANDAERARQARQAEQQGGGLEPHDSRNVTGAAGAGVSTPGGADQQEGGARWGDDQQQKDQVAARQPDATTAAGQQPGIDRREMQAEQQGNRPRQPGSMSPEAQHMAEAHVPPQHQPQGSAQRNQGTGQTMGGQQGMQQSMGGMSQGFSAEAAARAPEQQGFVDQQTASMGGVDQPNAGMNREVGSDEQVESVLGVGEEDLSSGSTEGQAGGSGQSSASPAGQIREHMEVVGADGVHLGTVDAIEGDRIKLTKADSGMGSHEGHHHYLSCALVAAVDGNHVRLSATAANAYAMEEEK